MQIPTTRKAIERRLDYLDDKAEWTKEEAEEHEILSAAFQDSRSILLQD